MKTSQINLSRTSTLLVASLTLSGCGTYSNLVNSLGPDRPVSDLRQLVERPVILSEGPSPFCALPSETYIVMPEEGKVGTVVVTFVDGSEQVLQGDYSGMTLTGNKAETFTGDEQQLQDMFGSTLDAMPAAPYHARLYFILDKDELTPESKLKANEVFGEIKQRQIAEIIIVGHTDTAASYAHNEKLSKRRALKVQQLLIDGGIDPTIIQTSGAGEYKLLVDTPNNTPEPKNRRVEIDVR